MLCTMTNNKEAAYAMVATAGFCTIIYLMCFALGFKNIYSILYRQSYYKSVFLVLTYVFGQVICMLKATSLLFIIHIIVNIER